MIKNVIFDMGGVLTGKTIGEYNKDYCASEEEAAWALSHITGTVEWIMSDRGTLTDEDMISMLCSHEPVEKHDFIKKYVENFRIYEPGYVDHNYEMEALITDLKNRGYKVYLFSNVGYRYKRFFEYMPSIQMMDGMWCSCEYKVIKPETESFQSMFNKWGLIPEECVFIDDSIANIEQAIHQGMKGIVYKWKMPNLRESLEEILLGKSEE